MKTMRLALIFFLLGSLCLVSACSLMQRQSAISDKLIRLHVVANSDSAFDQAQKLRVRDAVLEQIDAQDWQSRAEADSWLQENEAALRQAAESVLTDGTEVKIRLGREWYPTRRYDTFSLPAGTYQSLRVEIGAAEGHNWWCVVYPSLCTISAADFSAVGLTEREASWLTQDTMQIRLEFQVLEWIETLLKDS